MPDLPDLRWIITALIVAVPVALWKVGEMLWWVAARLLWNAP